MYNKTKGHIMLKKIFIAIAVIGFIAGCKNKHSEEVSYDVAERLLPCSIHCGDEQADSLPLVSVEIFNQFIPFLKVYQGNKPILTTDIPPEWEVDYKLENLSTDFDIWIISNINEISHKAMITLKETETGYKIISGLLIAYSTAIEYTDSLESEEWICNIDKDYTINVKKRYEKIYSSVNDSVFFENKLIEREDIYHISLNGHIEYEEPEIYEVDYMAIIQFADTSESGVSIDEDWVWNGIHMQEKLEDHNILFIEATRGFSSISIRNYQGEEVDKINMTSFLTSYSKGYLLLKKGSTPKYQRYCPAEECLQKVFPYFGIDTAISEKKDTRQIAI